MGRASSSAEGDLLRRWLTTSATAVVGSRPLDGDRLAGALAFHGVGCTLHPVLQRLSDLPRAALELAAARRFEMACRSLPLRADLLVLSQVLSEVGAPWAVLKGPVAAVTLYGELQRREWHDLDVLVDRRAFGDVLAALDRAGVQLLDRNWAMVSERMQAELSLQLPNGTALDLHWHLLNSRRRRHAFRLDVDGLLARRRTVEVMAIGLPALSAQDQLLHLALHACLSGGHRLQWLKDVQLAAAATSDWDRVVALATGAGIGLPVALLLERARDVLGAPVPAEALDALSPRGGWRAVGRTATRAAPPEDSHLGGPSGRIAFMHARATTTGTALEVLRRLPDRRADAEPVGDPADIPLRQAGGTAADRVSYLTRLANERP